MEHFQQLFTHTPTYGIVICRVCMYVVPRGQISSHLREHHPNIAPAARSTLGDISKQLKPLVKAQAEIVFLPPGSLPTTGLSVFPDSYRCQMTESRGEICPYICRTSCGMQGHCRDEHQ